MKTVGKASRQAGGAIIVAMLAVALVVASAAFLLRSQSSWMVQTESALRLTQGRRMLLAGLDWAMTVLADDARNSTIDHNKEVWATLLPASRTDDWEIAGRIEDAQSRFNLNNLVREGKASQPDLAIFLRLLQSVGGTPMQAQALIDWMDTDNTVTSPGGAEDDEYLARTPPYRTGNLPLTELSNLLSVKGFDQQMVERLAPLVTVLPRPTPINVNTAPAAVLVAAIPGLGLDEAQSLVESRDETPFNSLTEIKERLSRSELNFESANLSIGSSYFYVVGSAKGSEMRMGLNALVSRDGKAKPYIVWRRDL